VQAEHRKVAQPFAAAWRMAAAIVGAVVSKHDAQKDNRSRRVLTGDSEGVQGGIDHPNVGTGRFGMLQALGTTRHADHVTKGSQDQARHLG